jgi:hypothetical protein
MKTLQVTHVMLLVFAFVCFTFAAWQDAHPSRTQLLSIGLAFLTLSLLSW